MQSLKNLSGLYLKILIIRQGARPFSIFANISYIQHGQGVSFISPNWKAIFGKQVVPTNMKFDFSFLINVLWHFKHDIWCLLLRQKRRLILRLTFVQFDVDVFKCFLYRCSKILRTEMYSLQTKAKFWAKGEMQN